MHLSGISLEKRREKFINEVRTQIHRKATNKTYIFDRYNFLESIQ